VLLFPLIILFCLIGVYSLNNNVFEIFILILFGLFGYLLKKMDYSLAPFILAMVLGPMMETSLRQSLTIAQGDLLIFFRRPFSATLMVLVMVTLLVSLIMSAKGKGKVLKER